MSENNELLANFLDEAEELLLAIDKEFVDLEEDPENLEIINAIFRPIHTMKGNSSFLELNDVTSLTHELETLLDHLRKEELTIAHHIIDVMLLAVDELKAIFSRVRESGSQVKDRNSFDGLIQKIKAAQKNDENEFPHFINQLQLQLKELQTTIKTSLPDKEPEVETIFKLVENFALQQNEGLTNDGVAIDESDPFQRLEKVVLEPFEPEDLEKAEAVKKDIEALKEIFPNESAQEKINELLKDYTSTVDAIGFDIILKDILTFYIKDLSGEQKVAKEAPVKEEDEKILEEPKEAPAEKKGVDTKKASIAKKTMRVPEESIDNFLAYVGELVIVQEMFDFIQKTLNAIPGQQFTATEFNRVNESFRNLSLSLQKSLMEIRKVPLSTVIQKVPRIIRDVAKMKEKKVRVEIIGENIGVDKSLVDSLEAPLIHIARNAADHGIENPQERLEHEKEEEGKIVIRAEENLDWISITISDDGKGLDVEKIHQKAIQMGVVSSEQKLENDDIFSLIFEPGMSTAEKVTEISGRGVGMDVVKKNIDSMGGKIRVHSEKTKGSQFVLELPKSVSTQIIDGYLVQVGEECYILPIEQVEETCSSHTAKTHDVAGKGECVLIRGQVLPLVRLPKIFGLMDEEPQEESIMAILNVEGKRFVMQVTKVLGMQQVVLKEIKGLQMEENLFVGGALRGDGRVAMIIDTIYISENVSHYQRTQISEDLQAKYA